MNRLALGAICVVVLNLLAAASHGAAHVCAMVPLALWQRTFVLTTVYALPIASAVLYWTPWKRAAAALLAASMIAATLFGIYFHFIADTGDNVRYQASDTEGMFFTLTAVLLIPAGLLGVGYGAWTWIKLKPDVR